MPYLKNLPDWLTQSDHLLRAYPTTTRIVTKYKLSSPKRKRKRASSEPADTADAARGELTLKTFDPRSGACLKYRTDQAAEINRVVRCLGLLGQGMVGTPVEDVGSKLEAPVVQSAAPVGTQEVKEEGEKREEGKKKRRKGKR